MRFIKPSILLLILVLAACAGQSNYRDMLQSWVGKSSDQLVDVWGGPDSIYQKDDGTKLLTFNRSQLTSSPAYGGMYGSNRGFGVGMGMPFYETEERRCRTTFHVNKAKKITQYQYQGDYCYGADNLAPPKK